MKLGSQDKLALMMTAYGTKASLARELSISPRTLGRWLLEGQEGGVKAIPDNEFARKALAIVFNHYKATIRNYAKKVGSPFFEKIPVAVKRPYLHRPDEKTGLPVRGTRLIIEYTQFFSRNLRHEFMTAMHGTGLMNAVSIRSTINLYDYNKRAEVTERPPIGRRDWGTEQSRIELVNEDLALIGEQIKEKIPHRIDTEIKKKLKKLKPHVHLKPIYTRLEDIRAFTDVGQVIENLDRKLSQKHEPATSAPGSKLADMYLFQFKAEPRPANYESKRKTYPKPSAEKLQRRRKRTLGHGKT